MAMGSRPSSCGAMSVRTAAAATSGATEANVSPHPTVPSSVVSRTNSASCHSE